MKSSLGKDILFGIKVYIKNDLVLHFIVDVEVIFGLLLSDILYTGLGTKLPPRQYFR